MVIDERVLDPQERIGLRLRELYSRCGYSRYRMSKFEEYDLYGRNRDYLFSDSVITFTDTTGRLMALKPDVTLSIVKNGKDTPGAIRKLYYCENVYRVTDPMAGFREETQVGVEATGEVDDGCVAENVRLALESLACCDGRHKLEISHLDLLGAAADGLKLDGRAREDVIRCAGNKNLHGISDICRGHGLPEGAEDRLLRLLRLSGRPEAVLDPLKQWAETPAEAEAADRLRRVVETLPEAMRERIVIDFSLTGSMKYYNGVIFKGFIDGVPGAVLSGGQYEPLMGRLGRKDRAIGFAVFLNLLERLVAGGAADD